MARISGELDLSQIPDEQYQSDLDLRVAVVREGSVLGSTVLKAGSAKQRRLPFEVEFEPPLLPGGRLPCPVVLFAGPDMPDREFLSIDTVRQVVEFGEVKGRSAAKASAPRTAELKLGQIVVEPAVYWCWLVCCRTYTINGRIVCRNWHYDPIRRRWWFCDEPVPGAVVEVWDVDRFWWWYWRDQIASAVTDIHGNFHITFRWCCLRWLPWLRPNPAIDPEIVERIQQLLAAAQIPLPPVPHGPDPDPTFFQHLLGDAAGLPGAARAGAIQGSALSPVQQSAADISAEALRAVLPPSSELATLHVWPWWNRSDCAPDVVFRATQRCGDRNSVIYTETNAETRWDIPTTLNVTLIANDLACCVPTCRDPECPECMKLTWVGCTPVDLISADAGPPDLRGYARTGAADADPWKDNPFSGAMRIRGGVGWDVDYFKVQYSKDGAPWVDLPIPAFGDFFRNYWDGSVFPQVHFQPVQNNGQTVIITRRHYEEIPPGNSIPRFGGEVFWTDYDTLFIFDTVAQPGLIPDGLYQLRFVGYTADAADKLILASERILPTCGEETAERVYLRIDNRAMVHPAATLPAPCKTPHACGGIHSCTVEPDCWIREIWKNEGMPGQECVSACDIVRLEPNDTVTIHFSVTCPTTVQDGHLGGYWLRAEYAVNQFFYIVNTSGAVGSLQPDPTIEVGPGYSQALVQGAARAHWYGGDFKAVLRGSDFPECCAYLLRLKAWKRTTDGCSWPPDTHNNEFELAFTVLRQDMCPDICPPPHAAPGNGNGNGGPN
jgi:hypothetical protein